MKCVLAKLADKVKKHHLSSHVAKKPRRSLSPQPQVVAPPLPVDNNDSDIEMADDCDHIPPPIDAPHTIHSEDTKTLPPFVDDQLWVDKYAPKTFKDLTLNRNKYKTGFGKPGALDVLKGWVIDPKRKPFMALLHGPPGVGKTAGAVIVLKEAGYEVEHINASDVRTRKQLTDLVRMASTMRKFTERGLSRQAVVVDELDGALRHTGGSKVEGETTDSKSGIRGMVALCDEFEKSKIMHPAPIILIANKAHDRGFDALKRRSMVIPFYRSWNTDALMDKAKAIMVAEGVYLHETTLYGLAQAANGDMRSMINSLQMACSDTSQRSNNIGKLEGVIDDPFSGARRLLTYRYTMDDATIISCMETSPFYISSVLAHNASRLPNADIGEINALYRDISDADCSAWNARDLQIGLSVRTRLRKSRMGAPTKQKGRREDVFGIEKPRFAPRGETGMSSKLHTLRRALSFCGAISPSMVSSTGAGDLLRIMLLYLENTPKHIKTNPIPGYLTNEEWKTAVDFCQEVEMQMSGIIPHAKTTKKRRT